MSGNSNIPTVFVIFGGTGDLTYRKLLPAFSDLVKQGHFDLENLQIVSIGRRDYTTQSYIQRVWSGIEEFARLKQMDQESQETFKKMITYYKMDYTEANDYSGLRDYLKSMFTGSVRYIFYLAVAPQSFSIISTHLKDSQILEDPAQKQVMIEKPFGDNLENAIAINEVIHEAFEENEIYRIDHYLAKEMIINIMTIRFGNAVFKNLWEHGEIDNVQITAFEMIGVEDRGPYYDKVGALQDMVQSHLLQVLSIILMPQPKSMAAKDIHEAQESVLANLKLYESIENSYVKGQYVGNEETKSYRDESRVDPETMTETYAALEFEYQVNPFKKVPIYVRTGKRLDKAGTYVAIQFKPLKMEGQTELPPNVLIIRIGPDEGIYLKVNIKKPGITTNVQPITMDFCQSCILENRYNTPEAYERLFMMAFNQDTTLFASWNFSYLSWQIIDEIERLSQEKEIPLYPYDVFSSGPKEATQMLEKNGHTWIDDTVYGETFEN